MKLLKAELEQIIKEEIEKVLKEYRAQPVDGGDGGGPGSDPGADLRKKIEDDEKFLKKFPYNTDRKSQLKKNKKELGKVEGDQMNKHFAKQAKQVRSKDGYGAMAGTAMRNADNRPFGAPGTGENDMETFMKNFPGGGGALGAGQLTKKKARSKNARQIALSRKTGISIKKMQKDLFDRGFAPQGVSEKDFVDGRPGSNTRQAIEDLQDDLQVKADGLYGPGTHKAWKNQDFAYARRKSFADRGVVDRDVAAAAKKKAAAAQSAGGNIARLKKAVQDAKINFRTMRSPKGGTPVNDTRYKIAKLQYQKAQALLKKALGQQKLARLKAAQSAKLANRKKASQSGTANIPTR